MRVKEDGGPSPDDLMSILLHRRTRSIESSTILDTIKTYLDTNNPAGCTAAASTNLIFLRFTIPPLTVKSVPLFSFPSWHSQFILSCYCILLLYWTALQSSNRLEYYQKGAAALEGEEQKNSVAVVRRLYAALAAGDAETVEKIVKSDLEWWFHGPPSCQHLMRILTGHPESTTFTFIPHSITALGHNLVVAEGREDESVYWVHVWTLENAGCTVTRLREYFNTSLVVTEFKAPSSSSLLRQKQPCLQLPLWQSKIEKSKQKCMPGLILAI